MYPRKDVNKVESFGRWRKGLFHLKNGKEDDKNMIQVIITIIFLSWTCLADANLVSNVAGRRTQHISIPNSLGSKYELIVHNYGPQEASESVYIQASVHAGELPGMLVLHHLMKDLDVLQQEGLIHKKITVVPYANPIGLAQDLLGTHIGRFSLNTGTNFNRNFNTCLCKSIVFIEQGGVKIRIVKRFAIRDFR